MNYLNKKTVEDIDVAGKRVLVRCDFNVPFAEDGSIADPKRIDEALKILEVHAGGRTETSFQPVGVGMPSIPTQIRKGGVTAFVFGIDRCEKY